MRRKREDTLPGEDSFLDIVANLVGILIILIVVVGAQATAVWKNKEPDPNLVVESENVAAEVKQRTTHANSMKLENKELHSKIRSEHAITKQLGMNRQRLLTVLQTTQAEVDAKAEQLETERQIQLELATEVNALKHEIREVQYQFTAVSNQSKTTTEIIEHYPTPIAKTVFSDEIHFQLLGDKIAHVPLQDLIDAMKVEWRDKAKLLDQTDKVWETVGPIGNYRLHYLLTSVPSRNPSTQQRGIQFAGFQLQAVRKHAGESIDEALQERSAFNRHLSRLIPSKTTVSLWVYPDGFENLLVIREFLRESGFQTASWPLEFGRPISGGPKGFRTSSN